MMDGITYDANIVDTTMSPAPPADPFPGSRSARGQGAEFAESVMRDRIADGESGRQGMGTPDSTNLGKFPFERD